MAGELAHPRRGGNQDGAVRAALASIRRTTHWYDSTGMPGPHALLDGHRFGDEARRVPALLQRYRAHAGLDGSLPESIPDGGGAGASLRAYRWQAQCRGLYQ